MKNPKDRSAEKREKAAFKAIGIDTPIEHDKRYLQADEYLRALYKLWEGSWSKDALIEDVENDAYVDPDLVRQIYRHGEFYDLETRHIVNPSPQRTPFLFQAGTSPEKVYGEGQKELRGDHVGSTYKYDVYIDDPPSVKGAEKAIVGNGKVNGHDLRSKVVATVKV
ncbi:unnamed protein product [Sphagnum balticum]